MTSIEWVRGADGTQGKTWNPVIGCSVVSPGCANCYAARMAYRLGAMAPRPDGAGNPHFIPYQGLTTNDPTGRGYDWSPPVWTGLVRLRDDVLTAPLRRRKPTTYFVNSMSDLFHEGLTDAQIDRVFAIMALSPQHTFQVLTKRAARMRAYCESPWTPGRIARVLVDEVLIGQRWPLDAEMWPVRSIGDIDQPSGLTIAWPLSNVWLGVSTEDQKRADERVPDLLDTPAAVRFVSAEPLLGPIEFRDIDGIDSLRRRSGGCLDWIIVGGESGPRARSMHPAWARSIRDQCAAAGVAFFFKQWGEWAPSAPEAAFANPRSGWKSLKGYPHVARREDLYPAAGAEFIEHKGKRQAGRLLDGRIHDAMPQVRP